MPFKGNFSTFFPTLLKETNIPMKELANSLSEESGVEIPYSTLDKWKRGDAYFGPDLTPHFLIVTKDRDPKVHNRLLEYLLSGTGYCICTKLKRENMKKAIRERIGDIADLLSKIYGLIRKYEQQDEDDSTVTFISQNRELLLDLTKKLNRINLGLQESIKEIG